ncbi:MAG: hypothetical protein E7441_09420 [Ruminococcaceae bacterium]|nr:hypothetical protein [Oscillospiraceae bacterium]
MKKRQICSIIFTIFIVISSLCVSVFSVPDISDSNVYFKQTDSYCTMDSTAMMFRRKAILDKNENWEHITEKSMLSQGNWLPGLSATPKFVDKDLGLNMTATGVLLYGMQNNNHQKNKDVNALIAKLKKMLDEHPEGIVLYLYERHPSGGKSVCGWEHAVVLTGYDSSGNFYCSDPGSSKTGIINLLGSILTSKKRANTQSLKELLSYSVKIWYVSNSSNVNMNNQSSGKTDNNDASGKNDTTQPKSCWIHFYNSYGKCKSCGFEYSISLKSMSATTYQAVKNDVPVRNRPYAPETITKYLPKGAKVTVVASGKNSAGNLWYKLNDGSWIYSKNLEKAASADITNSGNVSNNGRTIDDGIYVIETKLNRDYVLDVSDASTENGANVQIWKKNGTGAQSFRVTYVGDGYYTIVNTNSGKAVDVCNGATKSETNVWQYTINNTDAQLWKIVSATNGSYYIIGKGSGLYLDVDKAKVASGTNVKIYVKNEEHEAQKWYFTRSAAGGTTSEPSTLDIDLTQSPSTINQGSMFGLRGTVTSNYKITSVNGYIINSSGSTVQSTTDTPNAKSMDIRYANVNQKLLFDKLSPGEYTLKIVATDASGKSRSSLTFFNVKGTERASSAVVTPPAPVTPSPTPASSIRFELEAVPSGNLPYGKSFSLKGWFRSDCPIVEARAYMLDANKNVVMQSDKASSTTSNYKIQGYKLDNAMKFNKLSPGAYYLKYYVKDANGDTAEWISDKFYIVK